MWEAIRSNQRRSWVLIGLMGVLLLALGGVIGALVVPPVGGHYLDPHQRGPGLDPLISGLYGVGIAFVVWLIMWAVAVGGGDNILLSAAGARQIQKEHAPQLWNVVEEMTIASGMGRMPKVYIIDDPSPNALAVGYRPERAAVAVTAGLLRRLNRDELQGVIAHEIGHIHNLDVRFMTMAGIMVGSIVLISDIFLRSLWFGAGRRRSSRAGRGGGHAQIILLLVAIALAILAPLLAQLLYFSCSRRREYLADASAARFTRYPAGLAAALEKISRRAGRQKTEQKKVNRVVAPMYIVNPLQGRAAVGMFSTHPPIEKRVKILRSMGGAGLAEYEAAYQKVHGASSHCVGARTLGAAEGVAVRGPSAAPEGKQQAIERAREVGDLLAGLADFVFISCACGVRLKVPPDFKRPALTCPRCGRQHDVPQATAAPADADTAAMVGAAAMIGTALKSGAMAKKPAAAPKPMRYTRRGGGWESFKCGNCGHTVQLSPAFSASSVNCPKCNRHIEIVSAKK